MSIMYLGILWITKSQLKLLNNIQLMSLYREKQIDENIWLDFYALCRIIFFIIMLFEMCLFVSHTIYMIMIYISQISCTSHIKNISHIIYISHLSYTIHISYIILMSYVFRYFMNCLKFLEIIESFLNYF